MSTDDDTGGKLPSKYDYEQRSKRLTQEAKLLRDVAVAHDGVKLAEQKEADALSAIPEDAYRHFINAKGTKWERDAQLSRRQTEHARFLAIENAKDYGDLLVDYLQGRLKALISEVVPGDVKVTTAREIWGPDLWWKEQWHDDASKTQHRSTAIFEVEVKKGEKTALLSFAVEHEIGNYENVKVFIYDGRVNYKSYDPTGTPRFGFARESVLIAIDLRKPGVGSAPSSSLAESWALAKDVVQDDPKVTRWRAIAEIYAKRLDAIGQGERSIADDLRVPGTVDGLLMHQLRWLLKDVADEPRGSYLDRAAGAAGAIMQRLMRRRAPLPNASKD